MTVYVGLTMFWSIFAGNFGFGQFWPKKLVLVVFDWKNWVLTGKCGFGRFWVKTVVLVDFD